MNFMHSSWKYNLTSKLNMSEKLTDEMTFFRWIWSEFAKNTNILCQFIITPNSVKESRGLQFPYLSSSPFSQCHAQCVDYEIRFINGDWWEALRAAAISPAPIFFVKTPSSPEPREESSHRVVSQSHPCPQELQFLAGHLTLSLSSFYVLADLSLVLLVSTTCMCSFCWYV